MSHIREDEPASMPTPEEEKKKSIDFGESGSLGLDFGPIDSAASYSSRFDFGACGTSSSKLDFGPCGTASSGLDNWGKATRKLKVIQGIGRLKKLHVDEVSFEQFSNSSSGRSGDSFGRDFGRTSVSSKKFSIFSTGRNSRSTSIFWCGEGSERRKSNYVLRKESLEKRPRSSSGSTRSSRWTSRFLTKSGRTMTSSDLGLEKTRRRGTGYTSPPSPPSRKSNFFRRGKTTDFISNDLGSEDDSELESLEDDEGEDGQSEDQSSEETNISFGVLLDFICRESLTGPQTAFRAGIVNVVEKLLTPLVDRGISRSLKNEYPAYEVLIDLILEEQLVHFLAEDICYFWRRKHHPEWLEKDASVIVQHASDMIKHKKQAECIRVEVEKQSAEKELGRTKERMKKLPLSENVDERHCRLQCFWGQLHKNSGQEQKKSTTPAPSLPGSCVQSPLARPASSPDMRQLGAHRAPVRSSSLSQLLATQLSAARPASSQALRRPSQLFSSAQNSLSQSSPARPSSSQELSRPRARLSTASRGLMSPESPTHAGKQFLGDPSLDASLNARSITSAKTSRASPDGVLEQQLAELRRPSSATSRPQKKKASVGHPVKPKEQREEELQSMRSGRTNSAPGTSKSQVKHVHVNERDFRKLGKVPRQLSCPISKQGVPDRREAVVSDLCSEISGYFTPKHFKWQKQNSSGSLANLPNLLNSKGGRPVSGTSRRVQAFLHEEWDPITSSDELLPAKGAFSFPWDARHDTSGDKLLLGEKYLAACGNQRAVPMALPFVTGHSSKLLGKGHAMSDADMQAVTDMLHVGVKEVEEVDLSENTLLTDKSLVPFFNNLLEAMEMRYPLQRLSLKNCCMAGLGTLQVLIHLLEVPPAKLQHVDFSGVRIAQGQHAPLCHALRDLPALSSLHVAHVGFQGNYVAELVLNKGLKELDLSWNCFDALVFEELGSNLVETETGKLQRLALCNSSSAKQMTKCSPILQFIEFLCLDRTLNELDLSMNRMDFRGALVIEDALAKHGKLERLNVSHNPFGVMGVRSLFRLLAHDSSALIDFKCENCGIGEAVTFTGIPDEVVCCTNPGGRYVLDLSTPYHRAILRLLCKICDRLKLLPDIAFTQVNYTPAATRHGGSAGQASAFSYAKDERGLWRVPTSGRLRVTFSLAQAMESAMKDMAESDLGAVLHRYFEYTLMKFSFRKSIPLCVFWQSLEQSPTQRDMFLNALSQDFQFSLPFLSQLCTGNKSAPASEVLSALLPWLSGEPNVAFLAKMRSGSLVECVNFMKYAQAFSSFNPNSPTGHYTLHLANMCDRAVAHRLILLDCWETGLAKNLGHLDTSQRANRSQIRNEKCNGVPIHCHSMEYWRIPSRGKLEIDYVSIRRPLVNAPVLEAVSFENILLVLSQCECPPERLLCAIHSVAHTFYLNARQFRMILGSVPLPETRVELLVALYFRIADIHNQKVFNVRFQAEELQTAKRRLGFATFFPFVQPEGMHFTLDLQYHDQRLATLCYVTLSEKESRTNLKEITLIREDGTIDPLLMGVPRSWENLAQIPNRGIFKGLYTCAPEERKFQVRKQLLQKYGKHTDELQEQDVHWWAGLQEAPEDVRIYLDFLVPRFPNVFNAYKVITHGTGQMSLREFEESIHKMKCNKFKGPDEFQRIRQIFRYLDPSGEGQVSEDEWGILDLLWKEIRLCIEEFDQFLARAFDQDLELAWDFFDEDKSGEIDADEWSKALEQVGYFGHALPIFKFIDKDDGGSICWDEFKNFQIYFKQCE